MKAMQSNSCHLFPVGRRLKHGSVSFNCNRNNISLNVLHFYDAISSENVLDINIMGSCKYLPEWTVIFLKRSMHVYQRFMGGGKR